MVFVVLRTIVQNCTQAVELISGAEKQLYTESPVQKLAYDKMQYAITLEMKYKIVNCK